MGIAVFHGYCCSTMGTAVFTLDAGLLTRSQYSEGPTTGHFDTAFLGFPGSKSKCSGGSQLSKLPLHASHVALPT
jgi:hypothetical protein